MNAHNDNGLKKQQKIDRKTKSLWHVFSSYKVTHKMFRLSPLVYCKITNNWLSLFNFTCLSEITKERLNILYDCMSQRADCWLVLTSLTVLSLASHWTFTFVPTLWQDRALGGRVASVWFTWVMGVRTCRACIQQTHKRGTGDTLPLQILNQPNCTGPSKCLHVNRWSHKRYTKEAFIPKH